MTYCENPECVAITNKKAYIIRGIAGSGKSTLANILCPNQHAVCSTDLFFINFDTGEYEFDPSLLPENHKKNLMRFTSCCEIGCSTVVCDNTNSQFWEYEPYIEAALNNGYEVVVMSIPWKAEDAPIYAERNTHGVPLEAIEAMMERWEPTPNKVIDVSAATIIKGLKA